MAAKLRDDRGVVVTHAGVTEGDTVVVTSATDGRNMNVSRLTLADFTLVFARLPRTTATGREVVVTLDGGRVN